MQVRLMTCLHALREPDSLQVHHELRSGQAAEASNIIGICKSILSTGFRAEETIISRDLLAGFSCLRFGDGMKRGLAAKLAYLSSTLGFRGRVKAKLLFLLAL